MMVIGDKRRNEIHLRSLEDRDLDVLARFDIDPELSEPFEWRGYRDPHARRRRWEQGGYLGAEDSILADSLRKRRGACLDRWWS